jgi:hypothetical protein
MRFFSGLAVALMLVAEPAFAADSAGAAAASVPPLAPGKAAGVQHAQAVRSGLVLAGVGGVIAIIVLAATNSGGGKSAGQATPQFATATTAS